jgi:dolichyl-phosphate-mannose-protein mannosyltransferase
MSKKWIIIGLLALGLATRFAFFGHPNEVVFDEVHFGKFISAYYTHEYYFDIHPPLGKMMIAGFGRIFDFKPDFSFPEIGKKFPDNGYKALRFLPTFASALLPLVFFLLALELGLSQKGATTAGVLIAFENGILSQTRYILLDAFLLLFGCLALLFYFRYRNHRQWQSLLLAGIFGGLAISIKWTGLTFLALPGILELIDAVRLRKPLHLAPGIVALIAVPLLLYLAVFAVHFSLLTKSGGGDAFMTPEFRSTLQGSQEYGDTSLKTPTLLGKFAELNAEMYQSNQRLTATHPYGSVWYQWPLMLRPIFYWVHDHERIYFLGNPLIWWGSTAAIIAALGMLVAGEIKNRKLLAILLGGYLLNLLPFIGIHRVMFLYHYLGALLFAILILVFLLEDFKVSRKSYIILCILAALTFLFFAPLTYGLNLSPAGYQNRVWLPGWL